jgi:hypothetical protein
MNEWMWPVLTFIVGLPSAFAWTMLIYAVSEHKAWEAAFWDGVVTTAGSLATLTFWSQSGDDWKVLFAWMLANCTGTYLNVRRKGKQKAAV